MKIAILSPFYPYRGGISQFSTSVYDVLSRDNSVRAYNFKRQYPSLLFPGKTQYIDQNDIARQTDSDRILDTANPLSYRRTAQKIREFAPDLFVTRYWMPYFAPSLGYVARHLGKETKSIAILDNVIPHEKRFFDKSFTGCFLNSCDGFVTLCDAVRDDLLSLKKDARYIVSPHPLYDHYGEKIERSEAEKELAIGSGKKNILFFGLIRDYKGLDILLESFSHLDDSYQLIIAGEPYGSFEKYRKLIDSSPNRERIFTFLNFIPEKEVYKFFSAADVVVLPYRSATQSGISSVAYHFGTPMITTDVGGLKETIGDKGTGIIVDNVDSTDITDAIVEFFGNPDISIELKENIRVEKERLSWTNFCKDLLQFYHTL